MGSVYQARDAQTGRTVALKLLHSPANSEVAFRFSREAQLLSSLCHPGIVAYVANGVTEEQYPFLAMEWLEGEDLAQRLARQPLSLSESLRLLRRISDALGTAHARGIIHRDLKPSNLFLRGSRPEDAVLLDFGLARLSTAAQSFTGSAIVLGTPGYMAPEQASSQHLITPSADIFSLGCVLYECLTGQAPFRAPHVAAVLAKILFSEPLPLRAHRPELSPAFQQLMDRMLAKDPGQRLSDSRQILSALSELEASSEPSASISPLLAYGVTTAEQYVVSILLATSATGRGEALTLSLNELTQARLRLAPLVHELQGHGARTALLADGSLLATFMLERGTATDQAALASHCALSVKERWPDSLVVITTGLSLSGRPLASSDVVDRAGEFLHRLEAQHLTTSAYAMLDDTTAGLLGPRFQLDKALTGSFLLRGEHLSLDESRPLLGRPTPCVGREQELALMEMAFNTCVEDSCSRALLVTAPAGTGKSRLRHEFLRRLERRGQPMQVLLGRGDPMHMDSAYGLIGQALRRLCGVVDGEPLEVRRETLISRITQHLPAELTKDTTEFLGELCGISFPTENSPKLRAAREDPQLMSTLVTRAMISFLKAETSQSAVLLMLEDLHWSDASTVKLVDTILRELSESPLLVLALARPEVKELFPSLWARCLQEVPLRGLSQKASIRLIHEVLGGQVSPDAVTRLVEQAAGNALFLEELIRSVAEGHGEETPSTVLAMLQSRLQRLAPDHRRALLAASIFGRTFWAGGLKALLEADACADTLERSLRQLSELEMVQIQPDSRFPQEVEYRFRHALVRDAAYSLVLDENKPMGHRLAGAWLEQTGGSDPMVLAEHYQFGRQQEKAAYFFTRAGERLFERQDLQGARRCLKAALACEPQGRLLTELRALEAAIAFWMEDFALSYELGITVLPELPAGSAPWARVMGGLLLTGAQIGRHENVAALGAHLLKATPDADAMTLYIEAACFLAGVGAWCGQRREALTVLERIETIGTGILERDGSARGWTYCTRGFFEHFLDARPWRSHTLAEEGTLAFCEVGSARNQTATRTLLGLTRVALGDVEGAISVMREGLKGAERAGHVYAITYTQMHLALVLSGSSNLGHQEEARHLSLLMLEKEKVNLLHLGLAHLSLARVATHQEQLKEAEAQARQACERLVSVLSYQLIARTALCTALRAQGRLLEAREEAERGIQILNRMGGAGAGSVGAWMELAETCLTLRDEDAANHALRQAWKCLELRAQEIPEGTVRVRFLREVPENARCQELVRQRFGSSWPLVA